jgi:hypothetical protein
MPPVFGNVSPFDPQLFSKMNEFASALLEGENLPKYSPIEVAKWLEELAETSKRTLEEAVSMIEDTSEVEFRRFYHDIRIQNGIARFFARKMRAAVLWHLYENSGDKRAGKMAIKKYKEARDVWAKMAEQDGSVYVSDISFGDLWQLRGHWANRIPAMDLDIANMEKIIEEAGENDPGAINPETVQRAIDIIESPPRRQIENCSHAPAGQFHPGDPMIIEMTLSEPDVEAVTLHYRHLNQAVYWQKRTMEREGNTFQTKIPGSYTQTRYPMTYYFSIDRGEEGIAIYPGLDENHMNMPYYVIQQ